MCIYVKAMNKGFFIITKAFDLSASSPWGNMAALDIRWKMTCCRASLVYTNPGGAVAALTAAQRYHEVANPTGKKKYAEFWELNVAAIDEAGGYLDRLWY